MKKIIVFISLTGLIAFGLFWWLSGNQVDEPEGTDLQQTAASHSAVIDFVTVQTERKADSIPIQGRLKAENRLKIFPEVQGRVVGMEKSFREGITFQEGETLVRLNSEDSRLQLNASRSRFRSLIASVLPDIKMDYPTALTDFKRWFDKMDSGQPLQPVPETENRQLHRFLSSRGVFDQYYQIKSAEEKLQHFTIRAPFTGVLSAVHVEPGQSVGPQNHLGTLVDPDLYIMSASVDPVDLPDIQQGAEISLSSQEGTGSWTGIVSRVNPSIDPETQMVEIYLEVSGDGLREGLYLEGSYSTGTEQKLSQIPKSALRRTGHVYVRRDDVIRETPVVVTGLEKETIWVSGLNDGDVIVRNANKALSGLVVQ